MQGAAAKRLLRDVVQAPHTAAPQQAPQQQDGRGSDPRTTGSDPGIVISDHEIVAWGRGIGRWEDPGIGIVGSDPGTVGSDPGIVWAGREIVESDPGSVGSDPGIVYPGIVWADREIEGSDPGTGVSDPRRGRPAAALPAEVVVAAQAA